MALLLSLSIDIQLREPHFTPPWKYPAPGQTWTWGFQGYLIPPKPIVVRVLDLPPRGYPEPATRTWTYSYNLNLINKDKITVGAQFLDRPQLPIAVPLPIFTASSSLPLNAPPPPALTFLMGQALL